MIPDFTTTFGGVGDGVTLNNTPLTNANSITSGYRRIYMPEGVYKTTLSNTALANLRLVGPGPIERGSYFHQLRTLNTKPGYNTDPTNNPFGENNVSHFSDAEFAILQNGLNRGINLSPAANNTRDYVGAQWIPHWIRFDVMDGNGHSGATAHIPAGIASAGATSATLNSTVRTSTTLTGAISAGATSAVVASAANMAVGATVRFGGSEQKVLTSVAGTTIGWSGGLASGYANGATVDVMALCVGDVIGFGVRQDGPFAETRTITGVTGNVVSWSGGLTNAYPLDTVNEPLGPVVSTGSRTMNMVYGVHYNAHAAGDHYGYWAAIGLDYSGAAGQNHFFNRATGAIVGGVISLSGNGLYATGSEMLLESTSGTNSAIAMVMNMDRNDDTFAYANTWGGYYLASFGADPIDWGLAFHGRMRVGLDVTGCDFSSNAQAAVNLADTQRIYFNSSTPTGSGLGQRGENWYGATLGNAYIGHGSNALSLVKGGGSLSVVTTGANVNGSLVVTNGVTVAANGLTVTAGGLTVSSGTTTLQAVNANSLNIGSGAITCGAINSSGSVSAGSGTITGRYLKTQSGSGNGNHILYFGDQASGASYMVVDTVNGNGAIYVKGVQKLAF